MLKGINPNGWKISLLDDVTKRGSGHTPNRGVSEYWNGGIAWVSLADSSKLDRRYIEVTDKEISEQGIKNSSAVLHPKNTVILSRDAGVGKSALLAKRMAVSQHFIAWQCEEKNILDPLFLYYWLQLNKEEFERQAVGSTIKTIGLPYFKKLRICYPPIQEQQCVVQTLQSWDNAIEILEALIVAKQQRKRALMQHLLTGKFRFPGCTVPWHQSKLSEHLQKIVGGGTPSREAQKYWNGTIPWITVKDLKAALISDAEEHISVEGLAESASNLIPAGTIIIATRMAVGKIIRCSRDAAINQDLKALFVKSSIAPAFLHHLLLLKKAALVRLGTGSTVMGIQLADLRNLQINIPGDIAEQDRIATVLDSADAELITHQRSLKKLKQQKKALMQQLLTGKKRLKTAA